MKRRRERLAARSALCCALAAVALAIPVGSARGQGSPCPPFSTAGYRFTGVKSYAISCRLGRAVVRRWGKTRFRALGVRFPYAGGTADFYCYFYSGRARSGKCKGGVQVGRRITTFGTVDWRRRTRR